MKNIFLVSLLFCAHSLVSGQYVKKIDSVKIKIYIIGVVHSENKFRNTDSLLNILKDIKPDLILAESDTLSGYFKADYSLVKPPNWYKLARKIKAGRRMTPEMDVLYKYREVNDSVLIFPFDMKIKNRKIYITSRNKKENKWVSSLNSAFSNNLIPDSILPLHRDYIKYSNWFFEIGLGGYRMMNRTIVTDSVRGMMKLEENYFPKVINNVYSLSDFKSWYIESNKYWDLRNEVMAKNIITLVEKSASKTVVVLTGFLHKYYLIDLLNSYNSEMKYEIVEYFENESK